VEGIVAEYGGKAYPRPGKLTYAFQCPEDGAKPSSRARS
jgi:hypothetical protein